MKPPTGLLPVAAVGTTFEATFEGRPAAGRVIAPETGRERLLCDECKNAAVYEYVVRGSQLCWFRCKRHRYEGSPG